MGSSASKSLKSSSSKQIPLSRVGKGVSVPTLKQSPVQSSTQPSTTTTTVRDGFDPQTPDPQFLQRLSKLGTVKYTHVEDHYSSSNPMLGAVQSRQKMDRQSDELIKKQQQDPSNQKTLIHPETITAILQSKLEGDNHDKINQDFNLDPKILPLLGNRFSIPIIVKQTATTDTEPETGSVLQR